MAEVTAAELLERIRKARDWAKSEADRVLGPDPLENADRVSRVNGEYGLIHLVVMNVLDRILEPPKD